MLPLEVEVKEQQVKTEIALIVLLVKPYRSTMNIFFIIIGFF